MAADTGPSGPISGAKPAAYVRLAASAQNGAGAAPVPAEPAAVDAMSATDACGGQGPAQALPAKATWAAGMVAHGSVGAAPVSSGPELEAPSRKAAEVLGQQAVTSEPLSITAWTLDTASGRVPGQPGTACRPEMASEALQVAGPSLTPELADLEAAISSNDSRNAQNQELPGPGFAARKASLAGPAGAVTSASASFSGSFPAEQPVASLVDVSKADSASHHLQAAASVLADAAPFPNQTSASHLLQAAASALSSFGPPDDQQSASHLLQAAAAAIAASGITDGQMSASHLLQQAASVLAAADPIEQVSASHLLQAAASVLATSSSPDDPRSASRLLQAAASAVAASGTADGQLSASHLLQQAASVLAAAAPIERASAPHLLQAAAGLLDDPASAAATLKEGQHDKQPEDGSAPLQPFSPGDVVSASDLQQQAADLAVSGLVPEPLPQQVCIPNSTAFGMEQDAADLAVSGLVLEPATDADPADAVAAASASSSSATKPAAAPAPENSGAGADDRQPASSQASRLSTSEPAQGMSLRESGSGDTAEAAQEAGTGTLRHGTAAQDGTKWHARPASSLKAPRQPFNAQLQMAALDWAIFDAMVQDLWQRQQRLVLDQQDEPLLDADAAVDQLPYHLQESASSADEVCLNISEALVSAHGSSGEKTASSLIGMQAYFMLSSS